MLKPNLLLTALGLAMLAASAPVARAQQPPTPEADTEWVALTAQLSKPAFASLAPQDRIQLSRLLARGGTRGAWLVAQAAQWKQGAKDVPSTQVNQAIDQFMQALPAARGGLFGATDADAGKWRGLLESLKVLVQALMEFMEPSALRGAIRSGAWDPPTVAPSASDWVKLWGRGLDTADLAKLKSKAPQLALPGPLNALLKSIEGGTSATPTFRASLVSLDSVAGVELDAGADALTRHAKNIALALQGRAIGADEAMLNGSGGHSLPTTAEGWLAAAGELETASAWRWASLARMLAEYARGGSAGSLASDYQKRFADQSKVDQRISQWLSGAGSGAGLAPFGVSLTFDSAGSAERARCAGASGAGLLGDAQSAKAAILGGTSWAKASEQSLRAAMPAASGGRKPCAIVEVVRVGDRDYVAVMSAGDNPALVTNKFADAAGLFTAIATWHGASTLGGVLIAPDHGIWPDASWPGLCTSSKAADWFAIIPSTGALVQGSKWNSDALLRLYCLERMRLKKPLLKSNSQFYGQVLETDAKVQFGFAGLKVYGPKQANFNRWFDRISTVASDPELPFLACLR